MKNIFLIIAGMLCLNLLAAQNCKLCDSCPIYKANFLENEYHITQGEIAVEKVDFKQNKQDVDLLVTLSNKSDYNLSNITLKLKYYDKKGKLILTKTTYTYEYVFAGTLGKIISLKRTPNFYVQGLDYKTNTIGKIEASVVSAVFVPTMSILVPPEYQDVDVVPEKED